MARVAIRKTNSRFFKLFRVYSNLLKLANVGEFYWVESLRNVPKLELRRKNLSSCANFYVLQTTSHKKYHAVVVQGRQVFQKACYTCKIC